MHSVCSLENQISDLIVQTISTTIFVYHVDWMKCTQFSVYTEMLWNCGLFSWEKCQVGMVCNYVAVHILGLVYQSVLETQAG